MVGRKQNTDIYNKLEFTLIKVNNKKYVAQCNACLKTLANTSVLRLEIHRNMCQKNITRINNNNITNVNQISKSAIQCRKRKHTSVESESDSPESQKSIHDLNSDSSENTEQVSSVDKPTKTNADFNTNCNSKISTESTLVAEILFDPKTGSMISDIDNENRFDLNVSLLDSTLTEKEVTVTEAEALEARSTASISTSSVSDSQRSCFNVSEIRTHSSLSLPSSNSYWKQTSNVESKSKESVLSSSTRLKKNYSSKMMKLENIKNKKELFNFIDQINDKEIEEINYALANFFFGCNIPLSVVESDHFKKFVTKLRPAYSSKLPSRKVLSTTLLDNAYKKCIHDNARSLNVYSVLLIDGWKNSSSNAKTVVCMLHNAGGSQAFLNAWDFTANSETGEKLTEIVNESIQLAKDFYNTTVYAVVSDNASAMLKMGRTIEIWHSNCNSHTANLLAKDVLDEDCTKNVITILKEFKQSHFERVLVDNKGSRIKLPCDTRWCSYRDSYVCLIKNLNIMENLIVNDPNFKKMKQNVKSLIFDDNFTDQVREYILLFDPICTLINRTQSANCSAAEATNLWLNLKFPEQFAYLNPKLEHRRTMALNVYTLSAFYLHPVYHKDADSRLLTLQLEKVHEFLLESLDAEGINSLHNFKNNTGIFKTLNDKNVIDPIVFWNMSKIKHPNLSEIAIKLMQLPAASAQIERLFSNWSYVHSSIRNRLTFERSKKLLHIYFSLKIIDKNESDEY